MASEALQPWIEIPLLSAPPLSVSEWLLSMWPWWSMTLLAAALLWWLLRQARLRLWFELLRLRSELISQRTDPRQVLFRLAQLLRQPVLLAQRETLPADTEQRLQQRFTKTAPSVNEVLELLTHLQQWLRR